MGTVHKVKNDGLGWVKNELDAILREARLGVEAFIEDDSDKSVLIDAAQSLIQADGVLRMVELHGAALLAEEIAAVLQAVIDATVARREEALEVLSRAILMLPDYLEHIQAGNRDIPAVLMPILNDLRTTRGDSLLSGEALFYLDLDSVIAPRGDREPDNAGLNLQQLAGKLRNSYQLGLLDVIRSVDGQAGFAKIGEVLAELRTVSETERARRLWWISEALSEALAHQALEFSVTVKALFSQIDRELKRLILEGEQVFADSIPASLVKNLLYYLAISGYAGKLVEQVKAAYCLDEIAPREAQLTEVRQQLAGPNLDVLKTVSQAMLEDLAEVKDQLEIYTHIDSRNLSQLEGLDDKLEGIAAALGMLGLGSSRDSVLEQAAILENLRSGEVVADSAIFDIAQVMLNVEAAIEGITQSRSAALADLSSVQESARDTGTALSDMQFNKISNAVVVEAQRDMAAIKETFAEYVSNPSNAALLENMPESLERIKGAMSIIRVESLKPVLDSLENYIGHRLIAHEGPARTDEFEALADAVTSVEYFLESLHTPSGDREWMLKLGRESVAKLGFPIAEGLDTHTRYNTEFDEFAAFEHELLAGGIDTDFPMNDNLLEDSGHIAVAEFMADVQEESRYVTAGDCLLKADGLTLDYAEIKILSDYAIIDPELDEDILEVFLEEAEEQFDVIRDRLAVWRRNPADVESLTTLRRSFHTLKGSGRLVGAELMGEFAWTFEAILNRVIDNRIETNTAIFEVLDSATHALPQMLEQIKYGDTPAVDIITLMDLVQSLSSGNRDVSPISLAQPHEDEVVELEATEHAAFKNPDDEVEDQPQTVETSNPLPIDINSELTQIFLIEAEEHTGILEGVLLQDEPLIPDKQFVRSLHTLKGASLTAGVNSISELCGPLESYAQMCLDSSVEMSTNAKAIYQQTTGVLREVLGSLGAGEKPDIDTRTLRQEIDTLMTDVGDSLNHAESMDVIALEEADNESADILSSDISLEHEIKLGSDQIGQGSVIDDLYQNLPDITEDQDPDLAKVFMEEAEDILLACDNALVEWRDGKDKAEAVSELKRQLHTLKGGARMSGFTSIGHLSHAMETVILRFADNEEQAANADLLKSLQQSIDRLHIMLEQVRQSEPVSPANDLIAYFEDFRDTTVRAEQISFEPAISDPECIRETSENETASPTITQTHAPNEEFPITSTKGRVEQVPELDQERIQAAFDLARHAARQKPSSTQAPVSKPVSAQEMIRVSADLLDSLVNNAGEVNIYQSRFVQQTHSYGYNLVELEQTVTRLREQLRKMEIETEKQILFRHERDTDSRPGNFDPLELDRYSNIQQLSRSLGESVNDLVSIKNILLDLVRDTETLLSQQSRVSTDLQEGLMRTRMVQFSGVIPRLRRIVRQTADELGKYVELQVLGEHNEIDRSVLNRMVAPLEHLLRNAISHGIETPERRDKAGKPKNGKIRISISREGAEVVMQVSDDGAGIDREAVLEKACQQKLVNRRQKLTDQDILSLILESGFSTASQVTQIAGRGVGMDVVDSEIKQLGGALNIESEFGEGARFTIRLPFTLSVTQALLLQSGDEVYCVPLTSIEGVIRLGVEELSEKYQQTNPVYTYANQTYQLMHLGDLLGHSKPLLESPGAMFPVLLVRSGENRIALQVEAVQGNREIVLKPIGKQLSKVRGISGATILGDGRVILMLDVTGLVRLGAGIHIFGRAQTEDLARPELKSSTILVVDDSITIRKITTRFLERNNYTVMTAKDGVDAAGILQEQIPDLILLDIEMPRMDGFELAMHIRNSERLKHIPIIMITSRTGDKHRNRAFEIGVNDYLGKPYKEPELLEHIQQILTPESVAAEVSNG